PASNGSLLTTPSRRPVSRTTAPTGTDTCRASSAASSPTVASSSQSTARSRSGASASAATLSSSRISHLTFRRAVSARSGLAGPWNVAALVGGVLARQQLLEQRHRLGLEIGDTDRTKFDGEGLGYLQHAVPSVSAVFDSQQVSPQQLLAGADADTRPGGGGGRAGVAAVEAQDGEAVCCVDQEVRGLAFEPDAGEPGVQAAWAF